MPRQNPRRSRVCFADFITTRTDAARERGSVIVLVMVVLVLMVILGTAYIQVARLDRVASNLPDSNNIDTVAAAQITLIMKTLSDDIVDANGKFLLDDPASRTEPYDYESTNAAVTFNTKLSDGT